MKEIVEFFLTKGIIFAKLKEISNKDLNIKTQVEIYKGVNLNRQYCAIFMINRKSRFLQKDVSRMQEIFEMLKTSLDHNFAKKYIIIKSPLCSKARQALKELKWKTFE